MSKAERISKQIDWLQKIMMVLMAIFVYVTIYEFEPIRAIIVDAIVIFVGYRIYEKMNMKLKDLEEA